MKLKQPLSISFADNSKIISQELVAKHFFRRILKSDYDNVLATDQSQLSDFDSMGMSDYDWNLIADAYESVRDLNENYHNQFLTYRKKASSYWDDKIIRLIFDVYGLKIDKTSIPLLKLFDDVLEKCDMEILKIDLKHLDATEFIPEPIPIEIRPRRLESESEIEKNLQNTQNPFYYSTHVGVSLKEAFKVIEERKKHDFRKFEPYRPKHVST